MLYNKKLNVLDELENLRNENIALKRAVESKSAAIGILRTELEECQKEREEFRMMAENRPVSREYTAFKTVASCPERKSAILGGSDNTLAQLLSHSKEENKSLRLEITDLRCRLHDAQSDLKILRAEKLRKSDAHHCRLSITSSSQLAQQERESLIQQLEALSSKCQVQDLDTRCLLEEREELVKERDEIRHKAHRLNHVLNTLLTRDFVKGNNKERRKIVDLDAIIIENRYLQQRMKQLDEEKNLAVFNSSKYKSALERCRTRTASSSLKLGVSDSLIMSPKQVSEFLKQHDVIAGENSSKNLKFLCVALLDSLNQKSRLVKSLKAANKMLIERVADLERRLVHCDGEEVGSSSTSSKKMNVSNLVSASLMEDYNPSSSASVIDQDAVDKVLREAEHRQRNEENGTACENKVKNGIASVVEVENGSVGGDDVDDGDREKIDTEIKSEAEFSAEVEHHVNGDHSMEDGDSNSDSEEIVPLEDLDIYISNLKQKRKEREHSIKEKPVDATELECSQTNGVPDTPLSDEISDGLPTCPSPPLSKESDTSFDLNISDYDSDDDTLEQTLQNWQDECDKTNASNQTLISKLSPKKSVAGILKGKKWKAKKLQLPDKLKEILN